VLDDIPKPAKEYRDGLDIKRS